MNSAKLVEIGDAGSAYNDGNPPEILPYGSDETPNPAKDRAPGTVLGETQREWFLGALSGSSASWKLWGNSLPLMPMRLDLSNLPFTVYEDSIFNIDSWAGFPYETRQIMQALEDRKIAGVVSLSGDHHMHGAGTVNRSPSEPDVPPVTVDFTVAGISSSPIFEDVMAIAKQNVSAFSTLVFRETATGTDPVWNMTMLDGVVAGYTYAKTGIKSVARWLGPNTANPGLKYVDTTANGYALARFTPTQLTVRFVTLQDCRPDFTEPPKIKHVATCQLPRWEAGSAPQLEGPTFEGGAPFPFTLNEEK